MLERAANERHHSNDESTGMMAMVPHVSKITVGVIRFARMNENRTAVLHTPSPVLNVLDSLFRMTTHDPVCPGLLY